MPTEKTALLFFNGLGGFSPDGKEYVISLGPGQFTPAPWINVIANPSFGFQVSESGSGYTWAENSRENKLTSWSNDPVCDSPSEVFYLQDEETGTVWTPTALPIREPDASYVARHGQGYSQFEYRGHEMEAILTQFVPTEDPIKISHLKLTNRSKETRRLSVCVYIEWVLGTDRVHQKPYLVTELDSETRALLARNAWNQEFASRIAFADLSGAQTHWTTDRTEFLGRNGHVSAPQALMQRRPLQGTAGAGLDPCAVLQTTVVLRPNETQDVTFLLGQAIHREAAFQLVQAYRMPGVVDAHRRAVVEQWDRMLETVQIQTPDQSINLLMNRWLLYQTVSCRLWARCGFYQAGGAFGFRDQLQDVMALCVTRPDLARTHILHAASRQFVEGDVQHWWHPPTGRGVRTRISDDRIWLPYVALYYSEVTGDVSIWDEVVPFLEGAAILPGHEDAYYIPTISSQTGTLFEHAARALEQSMELGAHGLPLIGTGDWNDGMNRVGHEGKGESVWLGFFLHTTLWECAKLAEQRNEFERAERWRLRVGELKTALEQNGWDGRWYRRAFFDDGSPLGSSQNTGCQIDSIAQSWAVLSGAADPARAARAMDAVDEFLVQRTNRLALLLTPPFDVSQSLTGDLHNPGYIQGYLPGVRENGGQYTHAAVWAMMAQAAMGNGDKAWEWYSLLSPIYHSATREAIRTYKVEPYVVASDVYSQPPHVGRGGWTWYTGAASWMYRAGLESILGFRLRGDKLLLDPCIPKEWSSYGILFRYHETRYEIRVENPSHVCRGVVSIELDDKPIRAGAPILLSRSGAFHHIKITLG